MNDLYLVSPIPVSVNEYLKPHMIHKGRGMVVMYETAAAKAYKAAFISYIQEEAKKQNFQKIENTSQHCYVDVGIYFPRKRMDANNHWKIMLDAITESKAVWMDDSQVCERVKFIRYDSKTLALNCTSIQLIILVSLIPKKNLTHSPPAVKAVTAISMAGAASWLNPARDASKKMWSTENVKNINKGAVKL